MGNSQPPPFPPAVPWAQQLDGAYQQGFRDGHLAGWHDAVAGGAAGAAAGNSGAVGASASPPAAVPAEPVSSPVQHPGPSQWLGGPAVPAAPFAHFGPAVVQRAPAAGPGATLSAPPAPPQPLDPAELARRKARREAQNINITLYIASMLLVAASALFVASAAPVPVRLIGVWLVTGLLYGAGLLLHGAVDRLRPAALAFAGTGLAIVPFAGLATFSLGFPDAPAVWLATSLIGTIAYVVAAVRLSSRLVVYLSMAFLLSTAWSSVAVLGAALAWYFTALVIFSAVLLLAGHLLHRREVRPDGRPSLFARPLAELGPWFAPVGLVASLLFALQLNAADHAMVLASGVIFYAVMAWLDVPGPRRWNFLGLQLSLALAAPFAGWMVGESMAWSAGSMTVVLSVQAVALAFTRTAMGSWLRSPLWVDRDVFIAVSAVAVAAVPWSYGLVPGADGSGGWAWSPAVPIVVGLATGMAVVPAFLPKGEWLPLPAVGAAIVAASFLSAEAWTVVLAVVLAYLVFRLLTSSTPLLRRFMAAAARFAATALAASALAAWIPAQPVKLAAILAVTAVISAGQLLVDTLMGRIGVPNPVTDWSGRAWAAVGLAMALALANLHMIQEFGGGHPTDSAVDPAFALAAAALTAAACIHSFAMLPRMGPYVAAELVAPSVLLVGALSAESVFGAPGAAASWGLLVLFLAAMGLRLRLRQDRMHRWIYWWGARAASLMAAAALYRTWAAHVSGPAFGGGPVTIGQVILVALVPQLLILAWAHWHGYGPRGLSVDMLATLCLTVLAAGLGAMDGQDGSWPEITAVALVVAAVAVLGHVVAVRPDGALAVAWASSGAMSLVALFHVGDRRTLEAALALIVVAAASCAARAVQATLRGAHFLLARIAATILAGVLVTEFTKSPAVLSLAMAAILLLQWIAQWVAMRSTFAAGGEPHILRSSVWLLLAAQAALPLTYLLEAGGLGAPAGHRWVVVLELGLLAGTSVVARQVFRARGASYLAIAAVVGASATVAPVLWPGATALMLTGLSAAAVAWRCVHTPRTAEFRWYWAAAVAAFLLAAGAVDSGAGVGIFAIVWLVAGLALISGAQLERLPWMALPGALAVLWAGVLVQAQVFDLTGRAGLSALAGFVLVVGALYLVRLVLWDLVPASPKQLWSIVGVALGGGVLFSLESMVDSDVVLVGAAAFTGVAALACVESPPRWRPHVVDAAVLASALAWFRASSVHVDLGLFWFVEWVALAVGALAVLRFAGKRAEHGRYLLIASASFASLAGLLTVFSGNTLQQLLSLLLFVALLVGGLALGERIFTVWGAIGVATAVLWYLRGYTYVLLALLALGLIALAVWRLNRKKPSEGAAQPRQAQELP